LLEIIQLQNMNYDLLNYLKSLNNHDWLWCYENNSDQELNDDGYNNRQFEQLINARLAQISALIA
jgi:hypothetical protein